MAFYGGTGGVQRLRCLFRVPLRIQDNVRQEGRKSTAERSVELAQPRKPDQRGSTQRPWSAPFHALLLFSDFSPPGPGLAPKEESISSSFRSNLARSASSELAACSPLHALGQ